MNTLSNHAMLVQLSIHSWTNKTSDRKVTEEVGRQYQVEQTEDTYVKTLVPKAYVQGIYAAASEIRKYHYANTLPWLDNGVRVLPSTSYLKYLTEMRALVNKFDSLVSNFIGKYDQAVADAKKVKKGLFDEFQYPSASHLQTCFSVEFQFLPLPDAGDFRCTLPPEQMKELKDQAEKNASQTTSMLVKHVLSNLREGIKKMQETLADPQKIFRDSLFANLESVYDLVFGVREALHDSQLNDMLEYIHKNILVHQPDVARQFPAVRQDIVNHCSQVLQAIEDRT